MSPKQDQSLGKGSEKTPASNRQTEKTAQTRARLLRSAETIFARDGFEAAKLEEIAADAGYTRGALYANFDSKEDLFIALLAEEVERRIALARERAAARARLALPADQVYRTVRQNYIHFLRNRTWNILFLEYKLFVLRHPEFRAKITAMQTSVNASAASALEEIFAGIGGHPPVSILAAATALASLANTISLDLAIGRNVTETEADKLLELFFNAVSGHPTA